MDFGIESGVETAGTEVVVLVVVVVEVEVFVAEPKSMIQILSLKVIKYFSDSISDLKSQVFDFVGSQIGDLE